MRHELDLELETSDNYIDKQTKWLYANSRGTTVFAIYGIGDGTEATVLYAVGGDTAKTLNERRIEYESNINRSERNPYKKSIERLGVQRYQYGNGVNRDGQNDSRTDNGVGQVSPGSQRGHNGGAVLNDSTQGKASRELDTTYLDAVNRGDMETAQRMVDERDTIKDKLPFITFGGKMNIWDTLYNKALEVQNGRVISPFVDAGGVAAAILTKSGNIYVGVCIDTCCSLGMCAERNAIANMITHGESEIDKVVAVMSDGRVGSPCGACRELMMQLSERSSEIQILTDRERYSYVTLGELMPDWWGKERFEREQL